MNLVQTQLLREVATEVRSHGGPAPFKAHALKHLELRTVLKESHCSPVFDLVFNTLSPEHANLFATVGKDQATVYDDEHMGDHLSTVVHYVNNPDEHHKGGDLTCCGWVQAEGVNSHELGDAWLAVSGPEGAIQVISVVEAQVTQLLTGHTCEVVELRGCLGVPGLLASLAVDGGLRLWDAATGSCVAELTTDAVSAELHPDGSCLYTGHRGGRICRWALDLVRPSPSASASPSEQPRLELRGAPPTPEPLAIPGDPFSGAASSSSFASAVDCIRCMPAGRMVAKCSDGRMAIWDAAAGQPVASLRVPGTHPAAVARGEGARCRISVTRDGSTVSVGNYSGDLYVYDAVAGTRVAHHAPYKVGGPARAVALSEDGRHLLAIRGNGYILRYEYIRKPPKSRRRRRKGAEAGGEGGVAAAGEEGDDDGSESESGSEEDSDSEDEGSSRETSAEPDGEGAAAGKRARAEDGAAGEGSAEAGEGAEGAERRVRVRAEDGQEGPAALG
ncbi:hypothetical protein HYH03_002191 [Edaphochlamys debaryana]|uniref:Uncharacterized protein n=1 Tax=Edaphochlamys debaryana TaxID=47281 RepID=A0A836C5E2_9CHLO|nr:hypothetical protein HYH03_002191 [Edaphochlamys debaryana]|eukprot:KAG2499903.1 hypothetical protein HYH03_002191 [Edaphochlamys debaryana]